MTSEQDIILSQVRNDAYLIVRRYNDLVKHFNECNMSENDATDYNSPKLIAFETLANSGGVISVEPEDAYDFVSRLDP
jgi:hypothetical protein